jgi:hypothetical protein
MNENEKMWQINLCHQLDQWHAPRLRKYINAWLEGRDWAIIGLEDLAFTTAIAEGRKSF